jgi:hypothetical protein
VTALVVVASVFAFLGIFASWIDQQVFDTDEWTNTSTKLLEDDEIRGAVSVYLVDELYKSVDVAAELESLLPPQAQALAAPAAGALRELAPRAANELLASPPAQDVWEEANRRAHTRLLDVLEDRGEAVSTAGGDVTLDLGLLVQNLSDRLGTSGKLAAKIPPGTAQLEIMKSDELGFAQDVTKLINGLAFVILPVWLAILALAIYMSPGRRRETVRAGAWGFIIAGVAVLIARDLAGDSVVGALTANAANEPAVHNVWSIGTSLLTEIAQSVIVVGVLILIGIWLAGRTRYAVQFRRAAAPYMRERPALVYGVVVAIYLLLVIWEPVRAFNRAMPLIIIAALMLIGTEALRRQTAREFPDAPMPEGGILESIRGPRPES